MRKIIATLGLLAATSSHSLLAAEGAVPAGIPRLNHVFVIVLENHSYTDILANPNAPFINSMAQSGNLATNYFAVGHPSLTNYLELVGGSNFGVVSDDSPDWHNASCVPDIVAATTPAGPVCPIAGSGTDAATPAANFDGVLDIPAATNVLGKTIADQLAERHKTWKSYQESLPIDGPEQVSYSDGFNTVDSGLSVILPALTPAMNPADYGDFLPLYAVKHNPFMYFKSVQEGTLPRSNLSNVAGFDGLNGLYADLAARKVPNLSLIVPNQCNDQHGLGTEGGAFCNQQPALISRSDTMVKKLVSAIKLSSAWRSGKNAIVLVWDENDFGAVNQVMLVVDTNFGFHQVQSAKHYTHFSLLRSLESGFGLPCLNHACDSDAVVMTDLFGGDKWWTAR